MKRLGLFQLLFGRVALVLAAALALIFAFTYVFYQQALYRAWQTDLQQEAEWTARHWPVVGSGHAAPTGLPAVNGGDLARAWRSTHDAVRLTVRDARGRALIDSHPDGYPVTDDAPELAGRAVIMLPNGRGQLVLSREKPAPYPRYLPWGLLLGGLLIAVLAAAVVYPVMRGLRREFERLSDLARRVADGEYGAALTLSGRRELDALILALNEMSRRLAQADGRRRRLTTDISHELRSPLARMRALSETIVRHPGEVSDHVGALEAEIALIDRLVEDLLQTARLEEGQSLKIEVVDLGAWGADAFNRMAQRLEMAGVTATCTIAGAEGAATAIDPQRMVQALGNLVENAVNATRDRPDAAVDLSLRAHPEGWSLAVADNGPGVPAQDLPFLFDRFFRVEDHRGRDSGGVGLGLGLVKAIAEAHGGAVTIENRPEGGALATLSFPKSMSSTVS